MMKKYLFSLLLIFSFLVPKIVTAQQYCDPQLIWGCDFGDSIDDFKITTLSGSTIFSHLGTGCAPGGYGDYTSDSSLAIELEADNTYNFEVTSQGDYQYIHIWIDFDGNGDFNDPGELVYQTGQSNYGVYSVSGQFNTPDVQGDITTRMRVQTAYGSPGSTDPCVVLFDGEVHDYTVVIVGEDPDCLSPQSLELATASSVGVDFIWESVSEAEDGYSWELHLAGGHPDTDAPEDSGTIVDSDEESLTLTGLDENKNYTFFIRSECDASTYSVWRSLDFFIAGEGANCDNPIDASDMPFTHSANTIDYLNIYKDSPGSGCGVDQNYLNGSDVVYSFTAEKDDLITISLEDLSEYYAGVFVYTSCDDIGEACYASVIAGPSTESIQILDMPVQSDETYYVVLSSWLTESYDYSLTIKAFDCDELESPEGDTVQNFVIGDKVSDLEVAGTRPVLDEVTWYEDLALTVVINDPSSVDLVDGEKYYVTQTVNGCESPALEVKVEEVDCGGFEISSFEDGVVACKGVVTLSAESSGTGTEIYWYETEDAESPLHRGKTYTTPEIRQTTSYWVSEIYSDNLKTRSGMGIVAPSNIYNIQSSGYGLLFEATQAFNLASVDVYVGGDGGEYKVVLEDVANNTIIDEYTVTLPNGDSSNPTKITLPLNFNVPSAGEYRLLSQTSGILLRYETGGLTFPYSLGEFGQISNGVFSGTFETGTYYYFFNWAITSGDVICESPRQEVIAKVDQTGDMQVSHDDLPYTAQSNTSLYGNNFVGDAGSGCAIGSGYLNGYEAMYLYTADDEEDNILQIKLSNMDNPGGAVFIYNNCADIGEACLIGAIAENGEAVIEDFYVEAGETFMIVVTSASGILDYTIDITGVDCDNVEEPTGEEKPYFGMGDTVADLYVSGSVFNESFTWYKDADLTDEITDLDDEELVDGTSYYVTQTVLGCESDAFEIIPVEFECALMHIDASELEFFVCAPGDVVTLTAQSSGIGTSIYWYDAEEDGNLIGMGDSIDIYVEDESSYWASEVFAAQNGASFNNFPDYCKPIYNSGCITGDNLNDFVLTSSSGTNLIEHFNTGCTPGGYADYTNDSSLHANLVAGSEYLFEATTDAFSSMYARVWIDLDGDGEFSEDELLFVSNSPGSSSAPLIGSFEIPSDVLTNTVGMRVTLSYTLGNYTACDTSLGYGETHDYKVTLIGAETVCESPRKEIKVKLNDELTEAPVFTPKQVICGTSLLSELIVLGENIKWYNKNGKELDPNSRVMDGEEYYVTQTVRGCESAQIQVIMEFNDISELPTASTNQAFKTGEVLGDLSVDGDDLTWYKDPFKAEELPSDTELEDQTTYYVSQTEEGLCESDLISITVHEVLDITDVIFESFEYYPNPVEHVLHLSHTETIETLEVYDLGGKKVLQENLNANNFEIDTSEWATGTYLMNVQIDGVLKTFRIIKK